MYYRNLICTFKPIFYTNINAGSGEDTASADDGSSLGLSPLLQTEECIAPPLFILATLLLDAGLA